MAATGDESPAPSRDHGDTGKAFTVSLDREGYSFQYAVLRHLERLRNVNQRLTFEVSEFPVHSSGKDGRVDFILKITSVWSAPPIFLICECKRANPALSQWCFARAPYVRQGWKEQAVTAESLLVDPSRKGGGAVVTVSYQPERRPYHVGLPVKAKGEKGDDPQTGNPREAIEVAAGQVMRALNGFFDFLFANKQIAGGAQRVIVLPVIFTTAALFCSEVDLGAANIRDGKLPETALVESVPWLWFQYHVSASLRHLIARAHDASAMSSLGEVLNIEYSRSIAIVGVDGIAPFINVAGNAAELFRQE